MLVALAIIALLAVAATELLGGMLATQATVAAQLDSEPEAARALQTLADAVANTTTLALPNGRARTTTVLALSANLDDDTDARVDEDPGSVLWGTGPGVRGLDDDGDGHVDEASIEDDDEDGFVNEDPIDGIDNDGDGSIDEDPSADANADGAPGLRNFDDDADGSTDEGQAADDDEDGRVNEDGPNLLRFYWVAGEQALYEALEDQAPYVILAGVQDFQARYLTGAAGEPLVELSLRVRPGSGADDLDLTTRIYPANLAGRHGITIP